MAGNHLIRGEDQRAALPVLALGIANIGGKGKAGVSLECPGRAPHDPGIGGIDRDIAKFAVLDARGQVQGGNGPASLFQQPAAFGQSILHTLQSISVESNISGRRRKKRYVRKSIFAMYPTVSLPFFNHNSSLAPAPSRQSPATPRMAAMRPPAAALQNYRLTLTHKTPTWPSSFHLRQPRELQHMTGKTSLK